MRPSYSKTRIKNPTWPASDDHPTHTKYSEFAPLKLVESETQWGFTFDKPGEWKYHDPQNPYLKGEVLVREDPEASDGLLAIIQTFFLDAYSAAASIFAPEEGEVTSNEEATGELPDERYEGIKGNYLTLVRDEDPGVALGQLRDEIESDDALARSCHDLVHEVGREAYYKYGDFSEAIKYQDEICNTAYLHGIIESRFSESADPFAAMQTMCNQTRETHSLGVVGLPGPTPDPRRTRHEGSVTKLHFLCAAAKAARGFPLTPTWVPIRHRPPRRLHEHPFAHAHPGGTGHGAVPSPNCPRESPTAGSFGLSHVRDGLPARAGLSASPTKLRLASWRILRARVVLRPQTLLCSLLLALA